MRGEPEGPGITVFDYGVGNIHSISKALELAGARVDVVRDVGEVLGAEVLVLPGVGDFGTVMRAMDGAGPAVRDMMDRGVPTLGICIGFQIMFEGSEEAEEAGLGYMKGWVERFRGVRLPHMGWNRVMVPEGSRDDPLLAGLPPDGHFYFANSYHPRPRGGRRMGRTVHGRGFPSIMRKGNTYGVQFHPEKSGELGLGLISNFVRFAGGSP